VTARSSKTSSRRGLHSALTFNSHVVCVITPATGVFPFRLIPIRLGLRLGLGLGLGLEIRIRRNGAESRQEVMRLVVFVSSLVGWLVRSFVNIRPPATLGCGRRAINIAVALLAPGGGCATRALVLVHSVKQAVCLLRECTRF